MTKRNFEALASALQRQKPSEGTKAGNYDDMMYQWEHDVRAVADVCSDANPRFNYSMFLGACGIDNTNY